MTSSIHLSNACCPPAMVLVQVEDSAFKLRAPGTPPSHPAAPAGPSGALAAGGAAAGAGAGASGALAGGGSNPAALPLAEQWAATQAWVIGLLGKLQVRQGRGRGCGTEGNLTHARDVQTAVLSAGCVQVAAVTVYPKPLLWATVEQG